MRSTTTKHRTKSCPYCAEAIRHEAVKCRFCGEFLYGDREHGCPQPSDWEDEGEEELEEDEEYEEEEEGEYEEEDAYEEDEEESEEEEEDLEDEEELLYAGRPSVFALTGSIVATVIMIVACGAVYFQPLAHYLHLIPKLTVTAPQVAAIERGLNLCALVVAVGLGLKVLYRVADLKSIYYAVTQDRIEWSRGIFSRRVDNIDMFRVIDLKLRRSFWDCLVGIGTVCLTTKDDSDPKFDFVKVRRCRDLYDAVKKAGLQADRKQGVIHID